MGVGLPMAESFGSRPRVRTRIGMLVLPTHMPHGFGHAHLMFIFVHPSRKMMNRRLPDVTFREVKLGLVCARFWLSCLSGGISALQFGPCILHSWLLGMQGGYGAGSGWFRKVSSCIKCRNRQTDRQTGRQADRQAGRQQADRQRGRQTYMHMHMHTRTHTNMTYIPTYLPTHIHSYIAT